MKCSLDATGKNPINTKSWARELLGRRGRRTLWGAFGLAVLGTLCAFGELPSWIRNIESGTAIEAAFFRIMSLPGGAVPFRRPPSETRPALTTLIKSQPADAELYSLRALEDEQQLDFTAAESDWKSYVDKSPDKISAELALADFYHRRLLPGNEINVLSLVANAPALEKERLTPPSEQRSWRAFERIFNVIQEQGLSKDTSIAQYRAWIARYPDEASLDSRFLEFLVTQKEFAAAGQVIARYQKQFPGDSIFPVKAKAMIEYRQGSVQEGLAVYEQTFQPLWAPELVKSYFDLLRETQNLRKFLDHARAALSANPEDLTAMARVFYYYQQEGDLSAAQQAVTDFRLHKESSKSQWSSQELYVCARLLEEIHFYPESARYYFALYNSKGPENSQEQAIAGLAGILLTAPETPIRFGSGEMSMYRDIATMDQGPGYLNGILSLILNTTEPAAHYSEEELRAIPYFHRARAAELVALLDTKFPNAAMRPALHAQLIEFYSAAGESDAVIREGHAFLANFPTARQRTSVSLTMADAYARKNDTAGEFAIYDAVLKELAAQAQNVPLGKTVAGGAFAYGQSARSYASNPQSNDTEGQDEEGSRQSEGVAVSRRQPSQAFQISGSDVRASSAGPRSPEYARVLERYLARLVQMKQLPQALAVLSGEIDRNPDDPGLYERLAIFLDQNRLGAEQEEVYRRAIARFADKSWYDKLARFYLRYRRDAEFEQLTRDAIKSFNGTDLEQYFKNVYGSPALYLRLNQYANQRFPHNPVFIRNLLQAYGRAETFNQAAREALLRQHWFEEDDFRNAYFDFLSRTGQLEAELSQLKQNAPDAKAWEANPAAADFLANGYLWESHFEESAPELQSLSRQYPAEPEIARTASSVYRSLAYCEPADTAVAAKIEDNLLQSNPGDTELMARIGDIYADRERFDQASPYWDRIPQVSPGRQSGYLEAATIYWDYFDFDRALQLLQEGRQHFANPNLYAYEAGAIYENKRDYADAIKEYVKGALENSGSSAELRLLQLARRPKLRDLVEQATSQASGAGDAMPAIQLRVKVLEAENRRQELKSFLDAAANNATSLEQAEDIENLAQQKSLEDVRQHALEKQIALTRDPITRLQLRYSLVHLYEARNDLGSAQRNVEALYRENPKVLGVVRSTVDFYWRTKNYGQAIAVLKQAAQDAYPELRKKFIYEAARKSTDAGQYHEARDLVGKLLVDDPYNGEYLAAMADTYAREGDDHGLQQFYTEKIALFQNSSLPADTRKAQTASLRRGLIPALTRMKDYAGAVDQYIELINSFPEDEGLVTEAALYGQRYRRELQLVNFYSKTIAASPRDYRWAMVLGRIQTNLENYSAAIETYGKAVAIRPDRADLFAARAELELRLMEFDAAAADYMHIYQLSYKDPQWMEKVAETRARQGKTNEAVAALKAAMIEGRPENAANYFAVASRLESWGMLAEARSIAEQGIKTAAGDLLADPQFLDGAKTYVRIMTRLRQYAPAYETLENVLADTGSSVRVFEQQAAKQGVFALTNQQWREHARQNRIDTARNGMAAAMQEMGNAVNAYFTPEERLAFASFADAKQRTMGLADTEKFAIPLAQSANLADQEAHWRFEVLMRGARPYQNFYGPMHALIDLQRRRGRFAELGRQMEEFAAVLPSAPVNLKPAALIPAADAYGSAGDPGDEMRVLQSVLGSTDQSHERRLFQLLLTHDPNELVRIAGNWSVVGQRASDYVVANGTAALSHAVVEARGRAHPPVWKSSYNALVGLYFDEPTAEANGAFTAALGNQTIAERLGQPMDRSQQLAGGIWFYYGSRYGEYLARTKLGNAEDFLPAILEESPATAANYLTLADYYEGTGDPRSALVDYQHTLDLAPNRPDVYDDLAVAYYKQGNRAAALQAWKQAFSELLKQANGAHVPETFWADFGRSCDQTHSRHVFADVKPDAESVIRAYLGHNGNWRSNSMLEPAYVALGDPAAATAWLLELATSASDPAQVLGDVADAQWIPLSQRGPIYQRILQLKQTAMAGLAGMERDSAQQDFGQWLVRWIRYLVRTKQYAQASQEITAFPKEARDAQASALIPLELQVVAQLGNLDAKLASYHEGTEPVPAPQLLRTAARDLLDSGNKQDARKILEFVFAREIDQHELVAANFLGLAEIRLSTGDTDGALDLLRRLVLVVGSPFENLDPAAALLEKTGHNAEAVEFLQQLVKSAPWNGSYRARLAKAQLAAGQDEAAAQQTLMSVASGADIPYEIRETAALALSGHPHSDLGSGELNLMAEVSNAISPGVADKFYFYGARIKAAQNTADRQIKLQLLSHCITDFPRREQARIPLFEAAASGHSDEFALGVIGPLLHGRVLGLYTTNNTEEDLASDNEEPPHSEDVNAASVLQPKLSRAEKARLAQEIGEVMLRLNRLPEGLEYLQTARRFEGSPVNRARLEKKIAEVGAEMRIQQQNAGRQPILHDALEQDRLVRPKVLARERVANATGGAKQ